MTYQLVEYGPEEVVFKQGELGSLMFLVQDGEVEVLQEMGGQEKQVAVLERGDFFGEMAILEAEPRTHSVRTLCPTKLVKIDRAGFEHMLLRNSEIAVRMIRKLSLRLISTEDMLVRAYAAAEGDGTDDSVVMITTPARLIYIADGSEYLLSVRAECRIGRADPVNKILPDIDLTKVDRQLTISRRHARLKRRKGGFYLQEERATNGTFVNGQRISAERPLEIRSGDDIMFGAVHMRFVVD